MQGRLRWARYLGLALAASLQVVARAVPAAAGDCPEPAGVFAPYWPGGTDADCLATGSGRFESLAPAATTSVDTFAADHNCASWASLAT